MRAANSKCVYPESDSLGMNWFFPGEERDKPTQNARDDAFKRRECDHHANRAKTGHRFVVTNQSIPSNLIIEHFTDDRPEQPMYE
jgi:hypothetical protein